MELNGLDGTPIDSLEVNVLVDALKCMYPKLVSSDNLYNKNEYLFLNLPKIFQFFKWTLLIIIITIWLFYCIFILNKYISIYYGRVIWSI